MAGAAFSWVEYLRLAGDLSRNADEASHRTSISRAYYCIYHLAAQQAVDSGYRDPKSHAKLWQIFDANTDRNFRRLAAIGLRMKKERTDADYDITATRIADRMNRQLVEAKRFLAILSAVQAALL